MEAATNTDPAPLLSRKAAFNLGFNEQKNKEGEKSTEASSLFLAVGLVQRKDFEKEKKPLTFLSKVYRVNGDNCGQNDEKKTRS